MTLVLGVCLGLASSSFLAPLGTEPARIAMGLLGFNAGIGLGLLAIVIVLFPVLYVLRDYAIYRPLFLFAGSGGLIALAAFWFAERRFDVLGPIKPILLSLLSGG